MKLNHKFRLVPFDDNQTRVHELEQNINSLLENKQLPDYKKMALFEALIGQLQTLKQSLEVPPVVQIKEIERSDIIPNFAMPLNERQIWEKLKELRANEKGEIVLHGRAIPDSKLTENLDFAYGKTKIEPYGYEDIFDYLESKGFHSGFPKPGRKHNRDNITTSEQDQNLKTPVTPASSIKVPKRPLKRKKLATPERTTRASKTLFKKSSTPKRKKVSKRSKYPGESGQDGGSKRLYISMW